MKTIVAHGVSFRVGRKWIYRDLNLDYLPRSEKSERLALDALALDEIDEIKAVADDCSDTEIWRFVAQVWSRLYRAS